MTGCGGGDDGEATGSSSASSQGRLSREALAHRVEEAKKQAERRLRQSESGKAQAGRGAPAEAEPREAGQGSQGTGGSGAPPRAHHDSGGGAAQFHTGGDESIQKSGEEADAAERDAAAAALHAFYDARAAGDWNTACSNLAIGVVATLEQAVKSATEGPKPEGCPAILRALTSTATHESIVEAAAAIDVGALRVEGDHGFLLYHGVRGNDYAIEMIKEGGAWKVGGLAGTPLS
jgi:hypothetical protein